MFELRTKYEKDEFLLNKRQEFKQELFSPRSHVPKINLPNNMGNPKKWEHFIKLIIRVIRHLSAIYYNS